MNKGNDNKIEIGEKSVLRNCEFNFFGNSNRIIIGSNCDLKDVTFWVSDDNNAITIGDQTWIYGQTKLACIEGTKIDIGRDCMFSSGIFFRTGDSHTVTDMSGNRTNRAKSICIGDHVWVGQDVFVGKGGHIPTGCIVGARAVVTKHFDNEHAVVAGNPAKIVKENVDWKRENL